MLRISRTGLTGMVLVTGLAVGGGAQFFPGEQRPQVMLLGILLALLVSGLVSWCLRWVQVAQDDIPLAMLALVIPIVLYCNVTDDNEASQKILMVNVFSVVAALLLSFFYCVSYQASAGDLIMQVQNFFHLLPDDAAQKLARVVYRL